MGTAASAACVTSRMRSCLRIFLPLVIRVFHFASRPATSILPIACIGAVFDPFHPELLQRRRAQNGAGSTCDSEPKSDYGKLCEACTTNCGRMTTYSESVGINRHVVGDERALQERRVANPSSPGVL